MGLNSSKAPRKVTKVAPMPIKGDRLAPPSSGAVYTFQSSLQERNPSSTASWMGRNPASEKYLPPLRETWQGRYAAGPRLCPSEPAADGGEGSIIKQHPPRRLQKLEPFILAKDIPLDKNASLQVDAVTRRAKELAKGGEAAMHPAGRRQYLLKMKMLEIRKEEELKRRLRQEARLIETKSRILHRQGALGHVQRHNRCEDAEELFATELDPTFSRNHDNLWSGGLFKEHRPTESHHGQRSKVETWLLKQQEAQRDCSSDASSTDSDAWDSFGKPCRRHALVRTKTERISLFDEFFDQDF
ncbi:uncharacterized protein CCDC198 [Varanus komodoensis]|uniref:uncharacterized protein CCDC198 n=1 Tax=Varanus komodoensis TaxID=61221 RepID=UPI001CF7AA89|nr:uncharacterized protein CCDC198 [Varanus komodoensis]